MATTCAEPVRWVLREPPLAPAGLVAWGRIGRRLAEILLRRDASELQRLNGIASHDGLALFGEPDALPWIDGVHYVGRDPLAPALLVPTALQPSQPMPLVERAVMKAAGEALPPLLFDVAERRIMSCARARPLQHEFLLAWAKARS